MIRELWRWRRPILFLAAFGPQGAGAAGPGPDYERDIKPIFRDHCFACHGPLKQKGGLRLDAGSLIAKGGEHGPAVSPGHGIGSLLMEKVRSADDEKRMPKEGRPLSAETIELLQRWIDAGARHPADEVVPASPAEHWAFQPMRRPPVPRVRDAAWVRNPIDAFVLAKLEARGWRPAPSAERGALFRRIHLDLAGFPPSIAEQETFAGEPGDDALDRVIDRLLARPTYGERWARHWLDVVRYADSNGYERDAEKPLVWRYRDYVINALNEDKPFGRFVLEQIAGDELPERNASTMIATGFLRLGHWDDEPADPEADRFEQLDDIVSTTGQAFLGLTIGCARCHDHKFEPLTQRDYYSLVAVFNPLQRPHNGRAELTLPVGPGQGEAYVWSEPPSPVPETHVLGRGSPAHPGEIVFPAVPAILGRPQPAFPEPDVRTSRRRLGLARWIADKANPLTARVIVNRVWQQHFGQGLVRTANDFGLMGAAPTHPELLDWLASEFVRHGGSLKWLHRTILRSATWRQGTVMSDASAASPHPNPQSMDPGNEFLWHMAPHRLEVEAIRDSVLAVSGQLNRKRLGPAMKPPIPDAAIEANTDKGKIWKASDEIESSRRTVYAFVKRGLVVPMLETLDLADTVSSCPQRQVTTVAPQALTLFNGGFVDGQAKHFAARLRREAGAKPRAQVRLAWRLALCREPTEAESRKMLAFLKKQPLEQVCRVILNLNEFVYPE